MATRLSVADAAVLHTQTSTTPAHTVALVILEASDRLSHDRLRHLVASSLPQWRVSAVDWWTSLLEWPSHLGRDRRL
jgi:hypothetical protein